MPINEPEYWQWRGRTDQVVETHEKRIDQMNGDAKAARKASEQLLIEVAILRTKIAIWASIGGVIGAGIVSVIVAVVPNL